MANTINRRSFLKGALATGAFGMASMVGCAPTTEDPIVIPAPNPEGSAELPQINPSEVIDADVVVVGAGLSGLSAAVQASELGAKTILLDKAEAAGGNGTFVEGAFAVDSKIQLEQDIHVDAGALMHREMEFAQFRPDGALWKDLIDNAASNIDWLMENGVEFSGLVSDYGGAFRTMHYFGGNVAGVGYVPHMIEAAQKNGCEIMLRTAGRQLIVNETGAVTGIYAQKEDRSYVQINAKAVILATGGFGANDELIEKCGWPIEHKNEGFVNHNGDGLNMALAIGARDALNDMCALCYLNVDGSHPRSQTVSAMTLGGAFLWVNKDGKRVINEDFAKANRHSISLPIKAQKEVWCLVSQSVLDGVIETSVDPAARDSGVKPQDEIDEMVAACPSQNIFKADTIEELAAKSGVNKENLVASVNRYNELCEGGYDADFGKNVSYMQALNVGPYYFYRLDPNLLTTVGALDTNRDRSVLNTKGEPIVGLYAIGVDGVRLYRNVYSLCVPATCCAHNIHSGRVAAKHAATLL